MVCSAKSKRNERQERTKATFSPYQRAQESGKAISARERSKAIFASGFEPKSRSTVRRQDSGCQSRGRDSSHSEKQEL
jgi:hypothetical protein